jgi:hypothetical protein
MTANKNNRTFELISITDMRPIDFDTGKRVPLDAGEGHECDRCGKLHAVIWKIMETTPGRKGLWNVGSTCGPKILDGWKPERKVVVRLKNVDKKRALREAWLPGIERAIEIGRAAIGRELPEIVRSKNKHNPEWNDDVLTLVGVPDVRATVRPNELIGQKELLGLQASWAWHDAYAADLDLMLCRVANMVVRNNGLTIDEVLGWEHAPWFVR